MNHKLAFKRARNADSPLYMQVADTLRSLIDNRMLRPGEKIPPTRELRDTFEVSTITVEAGIRKLVEENYLIRRPRRGTALGSWTAAPPAGPPAVRTSAPEGPRRRRKDPAPGSPAGS